MLGRLLRAPLGLIPRHLLMRVRGGVNRGYRWRVGASTHGCWLGTYERDKQALVERLLQPDMVAFDVGANAGFYTLAFSRRARIVVAFEPFAENVQNLLHHVRVNRLTNVSIVEAAVAAGPGLAAFEIAAHNAMGRLAGSGDYLVPTVSLDSMVPRFGIPDVVKMDIEGAEVQALEGAQSILRAGRTTWILSTHGPEADVGCRRILLDAGYAVEIIGGHADELLATPA
jgi:FkbM family methyltransferase